MRVHSARFGADFSIYVTANFEVHGALEYINNSARVYIDGANQLLTKLGPITAAPLFEIAKLAQQAGYGSPNPGKDFLYLCASHNEFLGVVYLTGGLTEIQNLQDNSFSVTPELVYSGVKNQETRLRVICFQGTELSDFGEKLNDWRFEARFRYFF